MVCVAVLCEIFIISCGATGVFCILTGQGTIPLTMLLSGLLLSCPGTVAYRCPLPVRVRELFERDQREMGMPLIQYVRLQGGKCY